MSNKRGRSLADVVSAIDDDLQAALPNTQLGKTGGVLTEVGGGSPTIVPINVLVTPRDRKRLRQLSLDTGLSLQKLGHEAWNRLLTEKGLAPLESVTANVPSGRLRRG